MEMWISPYFVLGHLTRNALFQPVAFFQTKCLFVWSCKEGGGSPRQGGRWSPAYAHPACMRSLRAWRENEPQQPHPVELVQ
eukprot:160524-Chlamydomonas_euryale.AAC.1